WASAKARCLLMERQCDTRDETTASGGHEDICCLNPLLLCLLRDLQSCGALARNDERLIKRLDQCQAPLFRYTRTDRIPILVGTVVEDDLRSVGACIVDLDARRVGRHDDDARNGVELRGKRDTLGMVSGGKGDHAPGASFWRHRRDGRPRTTELERAGVLQAFGLNKNASPGNLVEERRGEQRRAPHVAIKTNASRF